MEFFDFIYENLVATKYNGLIFLYIGFFAIVVLMNFAALFIAMFLRFINRVVLKNYRIKKSREISIGKFS